MDSKVHSLVLTRCAAIKIQALSMSWRILTLIQFIPCNCIGKHRFKLYIWRSSDFFLPPNAARIWKCGWFPFSFFCRVHFVFGWRALVRMMETASQIDFYVPFTDQQQTHKHIWHNRCARFFLVICFLVISPELTLCGRKKCSHICKQFD